MRMIETLTMSQKMEMLNGTPAGIFPTMILPADPFYSILPQLCIGYYFERSGEKTVSPAYEKFVNMVIANVGVDKNEDELMGSYIRAKFIDKWLKVYAALIGTEYDVINNKEWNVLRTGNNRNVDTYNSTKARMGTNTDQTEYGSVVTNDGNVGVKETTTSNANTANDVYGFNSSTPVGDTTSQDVATDTTERDFEHNKSHNVEERSGIDTKTFGINEDETHTGTDSTDITINENLKRTGREGSGASLITEELDMRKREIFFDIIYSDIDSVATLSIYI